MIFKSFFTLFCVLLFFFVNYALSITEKEVISHLNRFLATLEWKRFKNITGVIHRENYTVADLYSNIDYEKFDLSKNKIPTELLKAEYLAVNENNYKSKLNIIYVMLKCKYLEIIKEVNRLLFNLAIEYQNLHTYAHNVHNVLEIDKSNSISLDDFNFETNGIVEDTDASKNNDDLELFDICTGTNLFSNFCCNNSDYNSYNSNFMNILVEKTSRYVEMVSEMISAVKYISSFYGDHNMESLFANPFLALLLKVRVIKLPSRNDIEIFMRQLERIMFSVRHFTPVFCIYKDRTPSGVELRNEFKNNENVKDFIIFLFLKIDWVIENAMNNFILPFKKPIV